jgi:RNA polymerase sigma-70 factor (ECF subfamily)
MELQTRHELLHAAMAYATELTRFLRAQVADAHDAQDLMQELYIAILKLQCAEGVRNVKAYLFTIAARLAHQHRERRKAQLGRVPLDDLTTDILQTAEVTAEPNAPESAAALAERLEGLELRLNELSSKVHAAIVWHHRDGYTCDEIAERLSVVRHRVKKYLVKGLMHCRSTAA